METVVREAWSERISQIKLSILGLLTKLKTWNHDCKNLHISPSSGVYF